MKFMQFIKFTLYRFKLDCWCACLMASKIADAIGLKYKKLFLQAKTKFYIKQIKINIAYLKILTFHNCYYINEIKSELKYTKSLKKLETKKQHF